MERYAPTPYSAPASTSRCRNALLFCALRADPFDHVVDTVERIALRKLNGWDRCVIDAERMVATLAVEMYMLVVFMLMSVMAMAKFIAHSVATILDDVYHMVFTK